MTGLQYIIFMFNAFGGSMKFIGNYLEEICALVNFFCIFGGLVKNL
jgi:hypothetical protein